MSNWKKGKTPKTCNLFGAAWAYIVGCKGEKTTTWRYTVGSFGRSEVEYACPTCKMAKDYFDSFSGQAHQEALHEAQAYAGVRDYRKMIVKRVKGVPTYTGDSVVRDEY